ncbi:hypothetical protein [Streptomyces sp. AK02-01A]|uniref:hypothetical protein n=1 Tax=Streptomyces sp. AK02-01A TaxID=3028648 RepID=UPI0029B8A4C6|nr:hypothetical protein [Streptomyces sp. AK02-01A]MDX3854587.1 hypothetical protein [Streptomyces sp. AK02-01A]
MGTTVGSVIGGRGTRSCVTLFAVLAALLHVLGCAHGPVSAAPLRNAPMTAVATPDAAAAVSGAPASGHAPAPTACAGRAAHGAASCTDADEPSVLSQRTDESAVPPAVDAVSAADTVVRDAARRPARARPAGESAGAGTDQRQRAALGVWRN